MQRFMSSDNAIVITSRCAALGMPAFPDFFDDFRAEGFEVTGIARGDHALIDNDFSILPFGAGIGDVGLDRLVRCHLPALGDAGFDQQPGAWQTAATIFLASKMSLMNFSALASTRSRSGFSGRPAKRRRRSPMPRLRRA